MLRRIVITILLIVTLVPQSSVGAQTGSTPIVNLQFIVDQSGSMAAATDTGVLRMDAAKSVLHEVINQIPVTEGVNVGLRVYGHRGNNQEAGKAESCASTELLVPMAGVDTTTLNAQVDALQPVGWTPIGLALNEAQNDFQEPAGADVVNAIVLVTDGLETCGVDPAESAAQLVASPQQITTHVIGFGTKPEEQAILESITAASGGQLLESNNAAQLMSAIFQILEDLEVVEESGDGLDRSAPLRIGRTGEIGDYELTVINVTPFANDVVYGENPYNEQPAEGNQFFIVRVSVTYVGADRGTPWLDLQYSAVGQNNTSYNSLNNFCGVIPDDPMNIAELFPGGSVEFNVCWEVGSADADSLVMYVEPLFGGSEDPLWFSIGNAAPAPAAATEETQVPETESQVPASADSPSGDGSTRESLVPVGETAEVGDYRITVLEITPDATSILQAENPYNPTPEPGQQPYMARIQIEYIGDATGTPGWELYFSAVGDSNVAYNTLQNTCGVVPDDVIMTTEMFTGGVTEANVCWVIDAEDAGSLSMYVTTEFIGSGNDTWFSLAP